MKNVTVLLLVLSSYGAVGQSPTEILGKINKVLLETDQISITYKYQLYADSTLSRLVESEKAMYARSGKYSLFEGLGQTVITTNEVKLSIAGEDELMLIEPYSDSVAESAQAIYPIAIDSALKMSTVTSFKNGTSLGLRFTYTEAYGGTVVDIIYNRKYELQQCIVYMNTPITLDDGSIAEKPVMKIVYESMQNRVKDHSTFSISKYVQKKNGQYEPTSPYASYEFIDLTKIEGHE